MGLSQLLRSPSFPLPERPAGISAPTWDYVRHAHHWYDTSATRCRRTYWVLKLVILGAATLVTGLAAGGVPGTAIAAVSAVGLLVEGIQQTGQFHSNYISYRVVSESIHGLAWMAANDPSDGLSKAEVDAGQNLKRAVAGLISTTSSAWAERMASTGSGHEG